VKVLQRICPVIRLPSYSATLQQRRREFNRRCVPKHNLTKPPFYYTAHYNIRGNLVTKERNFANIPLGKAARLRTAKPANRR
jgi:hypothetical protein